METYLLALGGTKRNLAGAVVNPIEVTPLVASVTAAGDGASVLRDRQVLPTGLQRDLPVSGILDREPHQS